MFSAKIAYFQHEFFINPNGFSDTKFWKTCAIITVFKDGRFHSTFSSNENGTDSYNFKKWARSNNIATQYSYDWWQDDDAAGYNITFNEYQYLSFAEFWGK